MLYSSFGLGVDIKPVYNILEKAPKMDSISAQMVLRDTYETMYEIFNHEESKHPWDIVLHRKKEEVFKYSQYALMLKRYHLMDIKGRFGLSLSEFLELDRPTVNEIFDICRQLAKVENETQERVEAQMKNSKK